MSFWNKKAHASADERTEAHLDSPLTYQEKIALRQFRRGVEAGNRQFERELADDEEHVSFLRLIGLK